MIDWNQMKTAEQKAVEKLDQDMKDLRNSRDLKLADTDWWASSDLSMTEAQSSYRQALRDITETYTSLDNVIWPEKPE